MKKEKIQYVKSNNIKNKKWRIDENEFYNKLCEFQRNLWRNKLNTYYNRFKKFITSKDISKLNLDYKEIYKHIDVRYLCNSLRKKDKIITINLFKFYLTWLWECNKLKLKNLLYWYVKNNKCLKAYAIKESFVKTIKNDYVSQNHKKIVAETFYIK